MHDTLYCDHCGSEVGDDAVSYTEVPYPVASANKGESAVVCGTCDQALGNNILEQKE